MAIQPPRGETLASSRRVSVRRCARRVQRTWRGRSSTFEACRPISIPVVFPAALPGRPSARRCARRLVLSAGAPRLDARRITGGPRSNCPTACHGLLSPSRRHADPGPRRCCGQCLLLRERVPLEPSSSQSCLKLRSVLVRDDRFLSTPSFGQPCLNPFPVRPGALLQGPLHHHSPGQIDKLLRISTHCGVGHLRERIQVGNSG